MKSDINRQWIWAFTYNKRSSRETKSKE